jgi:hypothetical protein
MTTIRLIVLVILSYMLGMFSGFSMQGEMSSVEKFISVMEEILNSNPYGAEVLAWVFEMAYTIISYTVLTALVVGILVLVHKLARAQSDAAATALTTSIWSEEDEALLRELIKKDIQSTPSNT